ncbi:hypothetical protein [Microbacterium sp. SORGH_AS_0862]|uniref:hypothetical protein n=1 Tax=Microbacterium sp. SORGH_AS_0862 TaxID=3041789 RepID=UPI00278CE2FE|nr:hypothetical protein [Microbacterium sp. SORGH_AS_0862]MDQ1205228.1 hypothetical protein [Microbacterium sp. SORGH_AS_0862]
MTPLVKRTGRARAALASGLLLASVVALSAASFTDNALLNFGTGAAGSGVGNPDKFDIAVLDAAGQWQDAASPSGAVVLSPTTGAAFSETTPVVFEATFLNRAPGVAGDLTLRLWDPDPAATGDLYDQLRFTVYLDGATTAAVTEATAADVNAAGLVFSDVQPGVEHRVTISAVLADGSGISVIGKTTAVGVMTEGESR